LNKSIGERIHSTLVAIPRSRGLLTQCIEYQNVKVLVGDYDFRTGLTEKQNKTLANETCSSTQNRCQTGVAISQRLTRCIDSNQRCNRVVDCEDKSDEMSCAESFKTRDAEFFVCPTGYTECPDRKSCYRLNDQTCSMMRRWISFLE
jgi:hypothetical protein